MISIALDDPRLLGHPAGYIRSCYTKATGQLTSWRLIFDGVDIPPEQRNHCYNIKDYDDDSMKARQAALSSQLIISYELGLSRNTCKVLSDGNIEMQLTDDYILLLFAESFEKAHSRIWHARVTSDGLVYAYANVNIDGAWKPLACHRFLMNPGPGLEVDHLNGNGLDNRLCNLRVVNRTKNAQNWHSKSTGTGVPGLRRGTRREGPFKGMLESVRVSWRYNGKNHDKTLTLSKYPTPIDCVKAAITFRHAKEDELGIDSARRMRGDAYVMPTPEEVLARLEAPSRRKRRRATDASDDVHLKKKKPRPATALEGTALVTNDFSMLFPDTDDE